MLESLALLAQALQNATKKCGDSPSRKMIRMSDLIPAKNSGTRAKERGAALARSVDRVVGLRDDRNTGALGDEVIKMVQALILGTLPYRPIAERQVVRSARLSDGSRLRVTFTAGSTASTWRR